MFIGLFLILLFFCEVPIWKALIVSLLVEFYAGS